MNRIELTILRNLVHNDDYMRRVLPFLTKEYFTDSSDRSVYNLISDFVNKYNKPPTVEALEIALSNTNIGEEQFKDTQQTLRSLQVTETPDQDWLIDETDIKPPVFYVIILIHSVDYLLVIVL